MSVAKRIGKDRERLVSYRARRGGSVALALDDFAALLGRRRRHGMIRCNSYRHPPSPLQSSISIVVRVDGRGRVRMLLSADMRSRGSLAKPSISIVSFAAGWPRRMTTT
jgi:hypothetical protein